MIEYLSGAVADFNPVLRAVPDPVYVCAEGGLSATVVNWDRRLAKRPCRHATHLPGHGGSRRFPPVLTSGGQAHPIIGFVSLSVMGAWRGQQAREHCVFEANNASLFCVQLRYDEIDVVEGIPGSGTPYNIQAIRLVE